MLEHNADLNIIDILGQTPLSNAIEANKKEFAMFLIECGADVNECGAELPDIAKYNDNLLNTPLHIAAYYGTPELFQMLLDAGADATLRNRKGLTPMSVARVKFGENFVSSLKSMVHEMKNKP